MADQTPKAPDNNLKPETDKDNPSGNGRKAQVDDARDEGAGKASVPVDDVTTANDQ